MRLMPATIAFLGCMAVTSGVAGGAAAPGVRIDHSWARETPAEATVGAAYFRIVSAGDADTLVGASTPIARAVELHSSGVEKGVMRMRE
ncbi:MAG: copper chaperone PCu(A)C, partial [Proteobacteria bacterium]|nr:copper chaperone PCu(A)C [Pseudomonadota bacterium]